jgi:hypothetical protein
MSLADTARSKVGAKWAIPMNSIVIPLGRWADRCTSRKARNDRLTNDEGEQTSCTDDAAWICLGASQLMIQPEARYL